MPDDNTPAALAAPAPTTETPANAAPPQAAQQPAAPLPPAPATEQPAAAPPDQGGLDQHWLKDRLDRERKKTLKELGFDSVDAAKAAQVDYQTKLEAEKTAEQKAVDAKAETAKANERISSLEKTIAKRLDAELPTLTDAQRKAVTDIAGDDAAAQLRAIDTLRPTWTPAPPEKQAQGEQSAPADKPAAAPAQPATTTPPRDAPGDGGSTSPPDHKAIHARLQNDNPIAAAHYLNRYGRDIYPDS